MVAITLHSISNIARERAASGFRRFGIRTASVAAAAIMLFFSASGPLLAQNDSIVQELERIRRDLTDIQTFVYRSGNAPPPGVTAPAHRDDAASIAPLQRRSLEMQTQMRELTGQLERIQHDIQLVGARLDKLVADVDIRLQTLEGGPRPVGELSRPSLAPAPGNAATRPISQTETTVITSSGVRGAAPEVPMQQGSLGSISQREIEAVRERDPDEQRYATPNRQASVAPKVFAKQPAPLPAPAPRGVTSSAPSIASAPTEQVLPEGTPRQQYRFAFEILKKREYERAEEALRAFVERHPDDPLAGNAMYWMGETYYVRKNYPEAARIFLDAYQRFPKGLKASYNLYKLAKSLAQIGEKASACTTYSELVKTFPKSNARILSGARADMQRLDCG